MLGLFVTGLYIGSFYYFVTTLTSSKFNIRPIISTKLIFIQEKSINCI